MKAKATGSGKNGTGLGGFLVMFSMKNFGRRGQGQGDGVRERASGSGNEFRITFPDKHRWPQMRVAFTDGHG
jgi:hypothetical protein